MLRSVTFGEKRYNPVLTLLRIRSKVYNPQSSLSVRTWRRQVQNPTAPAAVFDRPLMLTGA